jgi:hypothetical protein
MNKKSIVTILLVIMSVALFTEQKKEKEWSLYAGGVFFNVPSISTSGITLEWDSIFLWDNTETSTAPIVDEKSRYGFEVGLVKRFNDKISFRLEGALSQGKEMPSSATYTWTGVAISTYFEVGPTDTNGTAKFSQGRVSLLLDYNLLNSRKITLNALVGPTVCFNKLKWLHSWYYVNYIDDGLDFDVFRLPTKVNESRASFGFTAGLELEVPVSSAFSIYAAAKYNMVGKMSGGWIVPAGTYTGILDNLTWTIDNDFDVSDDYYQWEVNLSHFHASMGLRVKI